MPQDELKQVYHAFVHSALQCYGVLASVNRYRTAGNNRKGYFENVTFKERIAVSKNVSFRIHTSITVDLSTRSMSLPLHEVPKEVSGTFICCFSFNRYIILQLQATLAQKALMMMMMIVL